MIPVEHSRIPDEGAVFSVSDPAEIVEMASLAGEAGLSKDWWITLIASCTSKFGAAEGDPVSVILWGGVLLRVLSIAGEAGGLGWAYILPKRVSANLNIAGAKIEIENRVGEEYDEVWRGFVQDLKKEGESLSKFRNDVSLGADLLRFPSGKKRAYQISEVRSMLREILFHREKMAAENRSEIDLWVSFLRVRFE
ncbi:hypothetical protein [Nocardiopsis sp. CC223A]|uniref:hypothetical protein n=1 Tax=Nocardiopsis sp. CC223A TaxID=3044051 RepID=UPI002795E903|nr:hypothetical protein [Nocardiopsis sp. CC223A]